MTDKLEETAQQIADRGREALIARLRPAFQEAAAAHSDVLDLTPEQLDAMVHRAVDRADGLQWRRALASVATEQLGISLGEALGHPAVVRAQELAGAPSYEDSLAQLGPLPGVSATPEPVAADAAPAPETDTDAPLAEAGTDAPFVEADADAPLVDAETDTDAPLVDVEADTDAPLVAETETDALLVDAEATPLTEPEDSGPEDEPVAEVEDAARLVPPPPSDEEVEAAAPAPSFAAHDADAEHEDDYDAELPLSTAEYETVGPFEEEDDYADDDALRVAVIHLGGIANLAPAERNIELQMSEDGLDIVRGGGEILGRLDWDQVKALEVPTPKGRRRMRRGVSTHLIVRTARGDASFEVPEVSPPELQQHLAPIVARHVRG